VEQAPELNLAHAASANPAAPLNAVEEAVAKVCRDVLAALVEADGGRMFLVSATVEDIHIHLGGTCAGCPGSSYTGAKILAPLLERVAPKAKLRVTTGWIIPDGAHAMVPASTR
jgi:Fe-S cluster biogenesis protein NfuA